jgi:hypothetical protein
MEYHEIKHRRAKCLKKFVNILVDEQNLESIVFENRGA